MICSLAIEFFSTFLFDSFYVKLFQTVKIHWQIQISLLELLGSTRALHEF